MIQAAIFPIFAYSALTLSQATTQAQMIASIQGTEVQSQAQTEIASRSMSLNKRFGYELPDNPYKDNILLNLAYISGKVHSKNDINWSELKSPSSFEFSLEPGQRFAYHDIIDPQYKDNVAVTAHTNFGAGDGYKYSDGLYGMGVCHLASLINWAAKDAGLESVAPTNHDFYAIPEVPKQYGVAIYASPDSVSASEKQNLYITNNFDTKVTFRFDFDGDNLKVSVFKAN